MIRGIFTIVFPKSYTIYNNESIIDNISYFLATKTIVNDFKITKINTNNEKIKYTYFKIIFDDYHDILSCIETMEGLIKGSVCFFENPRLSYFNHKLLNAKNFKEYDDFCEKFSRTDIGYNISVVTSQFVLFTQNISKL